MSTNQIFTESWMEIK